MTAGDAGKGKIRCKIRYKSKIGQAWPCVKTKVRPAANGKSLTKFCKKQGGWSRP